MIHYGNITCYTGSDFLLWAAFCAKFSRSRLAPMEMWDKEFAHLDKSPAPQPNAAAPEKTDKNTTAFLDRIVSDYGDSGVMEGVPVCFFVKNASILLTLLLTDPRHGWSPLERSTRRLKMEPLTTHGIHSAAHFSAWTAYETTYDVAIDELRREHPMWTAMDIRDTACDTVRDTVPLDGCSPVAITCNVRSLCNFFHNLRRERFVGLIADHPVFEELEHLRADIAQMVLSRYAPFSRKFDTHHDSFIEDSATAYVFSTFDDNLEFIHGLHRCLTLSVAKHGKRSNAFPTPTTLYDGGEHPFDNAIGNPLCHRENRHGDIPIFYETMHVHGEIYSTVSILREFKRHRTMRCYDVHINTSPDKVPLLGTHAFWRFTGTLGALMGLIELRTESKAHADIRALARSILAKLSAKYPGYGLLHNSFFFNENCE